MSTRARAGWRAGVSLAVLACALVGLLALHGLWGRSTRGGPGAAPPPAPAPPPAVPPVAARPPRSAPTTGRADVPAEKDPLAAAALDPDVDVALRWSAVDLDDVKQRLPDNLYWKMSAPTDDPDVLRWREEERARWNVEYGKVLSGNATDQEIREYFDLRQRISQDAVTFADYLLLNYGDTLPERDVALLSLASRLHRARLEEMPRRLAEALARKQRQDRLREAWLEDEKAFEKAQQAGD